MTQSDEIQNNNGTVIEPVTHVIDEKDKIRIKIMMPSINEDKIRIHLEKNVLTVSATDEAISLYKSITLPCEVTFGGKKFNNDILELVLKK